MPLAYVFAHRPQPAIGAEEYVSRLQAFHEALAADRPGGFIASWVWQLPDGSANVSLEDWYLVEDWAALGRLNEAAVSGSRRGPHDAVAPLAGAGRGAVYRLAHGAPCAARYRLRVDKPAGIPYPIFEAQLVDLVGSRAAVWKRQMVLGDDREFLIDAVGPVDRPIGSLADESIEVVELTAVRAPAA